MHYQISVLLEQEPYRELTQMAKEQETDVSALVHQAIRDLIHKNKKKNEEIQWKKAYEELGELNLGLAEMCLEADNEALETTERNLTESE